MLKNFANIVLFLLLLINIRGFAADFSESSFLISELNSRTYNSPRLWNFIQDNNWTGLEFTIDTLGKETFLENTNYSFASILEKINSLEFTDNSKLLPVFIKYDGDLLLLDSVINESEISSHIFYLPQGETWPSVEYLVQANRRIILFVEGNLLKESRILHKIENYALQIFANRITPNSVILGSESKINRELFKIDNFDRLPTGIQTETQIANLVPNYINYLLESWMKFGKKPNFIFVGNNIYNFDFIVDQLNSFEAIKGRVRTTGKNLEKVYWKNTDVLLTGGKFSFPFRGGEEAILSPFAPGHRMTPEQIIVTGEMQIPENYSILATPLNLSEGIKTNFNFEEVLLDAINPTRSFDGENFSFSQDIDRGSVLRLPEGANINLGNPELYGLPNSSFTVCCFVKFTDILEFGDNAILGNYETGYRRGMHLVLRSGHPYFGLYANDFISTETLQNNIWYHLAWRYILETGEQAIFVNGQYIGGSDGHPPYSGTSDIHLGSALSKGASMRGYIDNLNIWERALGNEEINRLSLDEVIQLKEPIKSNNLLDSKTFVFLLIIIGILLLFLIFRFTFRKFLIKKEKILKVIPTTPKVNLIQLFGEFKAINKDELIVTEMFTPKVKELFLFTLLNTLKNGVGALISDVDEQLWMGIDPRKMANNRAVTLNKLRKILIQFDKVEIISSGAYLQLQTSDSFFCDYIEAFQLCQIPEGMTLQQLELFFHLVKKGRLLKGTNWPWLDEIRGFTGNQVIDNLLKLASIYKKELKLKEVEKVALRILDYDDLNEEAIYLQIWALQKDNNSHLAKFNFNSFCSKYEKNFGEPYGKNFPEFNRYYSEKL